MHNFSRFSGSLILRALLGVALSAVAFAADGVVEINQARALAGGVTGGDAPGFPVTISESGSYILTGNLEVDDVNTTAIEIVRYSVDLDLNGFLIKGPVTCTLGLDTGVTGCSGRAQGDDAWGVEIRESGAKVHNGSIFGMGGGVKVVGPGNTIKDLRISNVGGFGIRNTFEGGGFLTVEDCVIRKNFAVGIIAGSIAQIQNNLVAYNGSLGIIATQSTISGNEVFGNRGTGISATGPSLIQRNIVQFNNNRGIVAQQGNYTQQFDSAVATSLY